MENQRMDPASKCWHTYYGDWWLGVMSCRINRAFGRFSGIPLTRVPLIWGHLGMAVQTIINRILHTLGWSEFPFILIKSRILINWIFWEWIRIDTWNAVISIQVGGKTKKVRLWLWWGWSWRPKEVIRRSSLQFRDQHKFDSHFPNHNDSQMWEFGKLIYSNFQIIW